MAKHIVGYTSGVFDMFHIGHLNILKHAKEQCDYLIVGVSTDEAVESYKHRTPIIPFEQRAEIIEALKYVDEVIPQTTMDKLEMWKLKHFDIMFHGDEWRGTDLYNRYESEFEKIGVQIIYLPHTDGISSSLLREKIKNISVL